MSLHTLPDYLFGKKVSDKTSLSSDKARYNVRELVLQGEHYPELYHP